jgi:hypothetical protein
MIFKSYARFASSLKVMEPSLKFFKRLIISSLHKSLFWTFLIVSE